MTGPDNTHLPDREAQAHARIARAVGRARLALLWERAWPLTAPFVTLAALFVALSWLGLWRFTATPVRWALLAAFAAAVLYCLWRVLRFRAPTHHAALARVEQATGALHQPARAFSDTLAAGPGDPAAEALWLAHRRRLLAALTDLRAGAPSPRLDRRDPYALRFLVALLFVVGFVVAGPERIARIGEAFEGGEPIAATIARIDAWVTPPAYTGRAPIFLTGEAARPDGAVHAVPTGSLVTVRTGGAQDLDVVAIDPSAAETPLAATPAIRRTATATSADAPPREHQATLTADGSVVVRRGSREVAAWRFAVQPDRAPTIALVGTPKPTPSGALRLAYTLDDDYGVIAARGEIAPLAATTTHGAPPARPLYEAPELPLTLPQLRARSATGETTRDLTAHPWAGATVRLTLVAADEAGQEGRSTPVEVTLPARRFANRVAAALVEQRAALAQDANAAVPVADALDALTMLPDKGIDSAVAYLAVRSAYYRLANARSDDDLRDVVDYLWSIALGLEDGDLSLAAEALRQAQEALRQALERNAPDAEIQELVEALRQAMNEFMQALAEQAARNPEMARAPLDPNARTMRQEDLERMIDRIEELARTGAKDAARELLSQLQNMMANLQAGQQMMTTDETGQQMMENLNELADMIRRQEELMNRTFQAQRGQEGDQPMTREELEQALRDLQQGQEDLARRLGQMTGEMEGMGMQPNGKLDQAGESMGRAAGALGGGNPGSAVGEQGAALEQLRQGAQGLAQQLAERGGQGATGRGFRSSTSGMPNEDPLGRAQRNAGPDLGTSVRVPDEIDTQRAREILDAIRRRLGEGERPVIEREYLERLLDQL